MIVGGGLIGLTTAWRLVQAGWKVSVWEAGTVGSEASWAGAGMLAPGGEMDQKTWWGDLALESLKLYPDFVRELQAESGVRIDYRHCGALEFAADDLEWEELLERASRQREWGIEVQDAGERRLFYPDDAAVDPRDLVKALRIACEQSGVTIYERSAVYTIAVENGHVTQPQPADLAVLAAGAWSGSIAVQVDGADVAIEPSVPIRGHLISFAPRSAVPGPIWRNAHTYILERSSGVTIAGSTTEDVGFHRDPDPALFLDIEQRARGLMPRLRSAERNAEWIGFRPGTRSGEPQLKQLENTPVYLAYGHYRNGILMAPATAAFLTASLQMGSFLRVAHP